MQKPKVILLDAVGTLFGVRGSVGEVYSAIAREFGVKVPAQKLNEAFLTTFATAEPLAFPGVNPEEIPEREFDWWLGVTQQTFQKVGVVGRFSDFTYFFDELYNYFATAQPWFIYPDVLPALQKWRSAGIELGILSNFDSRLPLVLKALKLDEFFTSITISTQIGAAKPDSQTFTAALQKHQCNPQEAWHIGDSFSQDYQGAKVAGLRAIWLERDGAGVH
ncbi:HAD-IA family hydrolase [Lyngbya aestuarii]|uniref:HAD-IA family hydrolase n=1 Tax=Lyngbya aestuarii TaxID=118322 RepID=UPI00403D8BCF